MLWLHPQRPTMGGDHECSDPDLGEILSYCGSISNSVLNYFLLVLCTVVTALGQAGLRGAWRHCWLPLLVFLMVFQVR